MESEFLQKVNNYFTTEFKQQIALSLDEDTPSVEKALSAIIPAGMASMIHRAESGDSNRLSVFKIAQGAAAYFPASPDLAKLHNEEEGGRVASDLLGDHLNTITDAVKKYAGIKKESAGSLIMLTMPVLVGSLGIFGNQQNLNEDGIRQFIISEKDAVRASTPAGFEPAIAVFDHDHYAKEEKKVQNAIETDSAPRKNTGWILPIILAIIALLLLVYFSKGCNPPPEEGGAFIIASVLPGYLKQI